MDENKFIDLYQRYKESGLSVAAFCENEIIAPSTFHFWKKKLKDRNRLPGFIPIVIDKSPSSCQRGLCDKLSRNSYSGQGNETSIEVEFPNGIIIRLKNKADLSGLKELIQLYN